MAGQGKKERYVEVKCPHCGAKYTASATAALSNICQECGREFRSSGVEVQSKESRRVSNQMRRRRREEVEADKERE